MTPAADAPRSTAPSRGKGEWLVAPGAGLMFALLVFLAFPPVGWWALGPLAPTPLIWLACRTTRQPRGLNRAGWLAALGAWPLWLAEMRYVSDISAAGYVPMTLILAGFTWVFVVAFGAVRRTWPNVPLALSVPVMWTGAEVFRGAVFLDGLPWFYTVHPLIDVYALASPARAVGVVGLMFISAGVLGGAGDLVRPSGGGTARRAAPLGVTSALFAALSWFGGRTFSDPTPDATPASIRAAIVQTSLPQSNKMGWSYDQRLADMRHFADLTRRAAAHDPRPDVILWPETMFPGFFLDSQARRVMDENQITFPAGTADGAEQRWPMNIFADALEELQAQIAVPMVVGAIGVDNLSVVRADAKIDFRMDRRFNSTFVLRDGRVQPRRFDKIALTPFGEYMPLIERWPWLMDRLMALGARGMKFDLASGTDFTPLSLPTGPSTEVRFAAPICFEVTRAADCRRLVWSDGRRQARLFINLTNDGWFGAMRDGRAQHLQLARWRCLELGTPMIRAANTGISAVVDRHGRIAASGIDGEPGAIDRDGVLWGELPNLVEDTPYAKSGDWVSYPVFGLAGAWAAAGWYIHRRRARTDRTGRSHDTPAQGASA